MISDKKGWELVHAKKNKRYPATRVGDFRYGKYRFVTFRYGTARPSSN